MIDKATAERITKEHYNEIYAYCLSQVNCNEDEAYEITQEVFLTFQNKLEKLNDINLSIWLMKTAKNKSREYFRAKKKADKLVPLDPEQLPTDDMYVYIDKYFENEDNLSDEYIEKAKEIVLNLLTKRERELYVKVFVEKKSYAQVAEEMNTNRKNVGVMVSRLRKRVEMLAKVTLSMVGQIIIKTLFL